MARIMILISTIHNGGEIMLYFVMALGLMLVVAVFAVQNAHEVTIGFLYWSFETSLVIVILSSVLFGALAVMSLAAFVQIRSRLKLRKAKARLSELETQNYMLKSKLEQLEPPLETKENVGKNEPSC
ncbi:MAG: Lipopolysaccharide assembly protein domain protein [Firmicutes bacterium]|nr:Lipopolysaccharide assembly protein domain protein [Bacillota bacterium]